MTASMTFNEIDLTAYNLRVIDTGLRKIQQVIPVVQLKDKGYPFTPQREARELHVIVTVTGSSLAALDANLDDIQEILRTETPDTLVFDAFNDRYYNALLRNIEGDYMGTLLWRGTLEFVCADPLGYDVTEEDNDHAIDADPDTLSETPGGNVFIEPVFTLTSGDNLVAATIQLKNNNTGEETTWVGNLGNGQELEIDVANWTIKKEGALSMATFSGQFPRLLPGVANSLIVTGMNSAGNLNIVYRNRYL